jgi:hypothetical protein
VAIERANDARAFRDFLDANLGLDDEKLTLYEYLDLWDFENSTNEAKEKTLRAIQQGLADADAGRSKPLDEFDREFRRKHGLPPRP